MSKYDFCDELKKKMELSEDNLDALYYPLNMFLDATGMDIKKGGYDEVLTMYNMNYMFAIKDYESDKLNYHFEFMRSINIPKKNYFVFRGKYNDLLFNLHLLYKKTIENNQNVPFSVSLSKSEDEQYYNINIDVDNGKTKFQLERNPQDEGKIDDSIVFYSNRVDMENIFEVIKAFINSPQNLYFKYKEVMNHKEVYFNNKEINCFENDELLLTNTGKIMKKVLNNKK